MKMAWKGVWMAEKRLTIEKAPDLQKEIDILRDAIEYAYSRLYELEDFEDMTRALGALGLAATRLASLLRVQKLLGGDQESSVLDAITRAIARTVEEQGLY